MSDQDPARPFLTTWPDPRRDETIEQLANWFSYRPPHGDQADRYNFLRDAAHQFAYVVAEMCPPSADRTVAFRKIREAVMVANASIACGGK